MLRIRLNDIKRRLSQKGSSRSISILVGGTALSQLITLAVLPLLTRLYSPENFSSLAIFVSFSGIISVIGCLRFEMAVPIPESNEEGFTILVTALLISLLTSILTLILLFIFRYYFEDYYKSIFLLSIYILSHSLYGWQVLL